MQGNLIKGTVDPFRRISVNTFIKRDLGNKCTFKQLISVRVNYLTI